MQKIEKDFPRIVISAFSGGAGKTILSVGIVAACKKIGKKVASYKKGPDYIDAGWLSMASSQPCYNLDTFLIKKSDVYNSFITHSENVDISVIEGNRGLYDGIDIDGTTSTAEIAKLLSAPVILCIDCTKATRTIAANILGCIKFDPQVEIKGVILNRVAGLRHENIIKKNVEYYCGIPVIGAIPKLDGQNFPERHMGLVPTYEHRWAKDSILISSQIIEKYINTNTLIDIADNAPKLPIELNEYRSNIKKNTNIQIGIIKDSAFQFYYPENIEAFINAGAKIVLLSPLNDKSIPCVDAIYIGGGFPETHVELLAENNQFKQELRLLAENGLPIYAECGGLMYLGETLILDDKSFPMTGILPIVFGFSKKPQGHGYTIITVEKENPYFKVGEQLYGHEFHYSKVISYNCNDDNLIFKLNRGVGFLDKKDGISYKNVLATYSHLHALGTPAWSKAIIRLAHDYNRRTKSFSL